MLARTLLHSFSLAVATLAIGCTPKTPAGAPAPTSDKKDNVAAIEKSTVPTAQPTNKPAPGEHKVEVPGDVASDSPVAAAQPSTPSGSKDALPETAARVDAKPGQVVAPAPASAAGSPTPGKCEKDGDCRAFSNYCGGCSCLPLLGFGAEPTCKDPVACAKDPCNGQKSRCEAGACVLTSAGAKVEASCTKDTDCRAVADYCGGCNCVAVAGGEKAPSCKDPVACLRDPCTSKQARCVQGACSVADAGN